MDERDFRMPLPSEDEGDLVDDPPEGMTDDPIVATEEGVPWDPPLERIEGDDRIPLTSSRPTTRSRPFTRSERRPTARRCGRGVARVGRRGRRPPGRRGGGGSTVVLSGRVESVDVLDEILGIVGDVPGVDDVVDEIEVEGV